MDALLWANDSAAAERQLQYTSPGRRSSFAARVALVGGRDPASVGIQLSPDALGDPGYVYNRSRQLRSSGQSATAASMMVARPRFAVVPREPRKWIAEMLAVARNVDAGSAARVAGSVDDMFVPGTDVSAQSFAIRDDYTSLMWLGGTKALWSLGDGNRAAPLFWRYGAAARTPQTRSKGFYWAGRAAASGGNKAEAARYFELAAVYPDQFYGMLALERLGRPMPVLQGSPTVMPTPADRDNFNDRPLTKAVREVARESDWPTAVRFFKEIAEQADSEADHVLVADLAKELGRRDLGVILGQAAHIDGHGIYRRTSFPLIPIPVGSNWTFVHAISRQESQFAMNAVSHAGARGLMQLMPGTAAEQAGKMGLTYDRQALVSDAGYNLMLGDGYFRRMLATYGGSYPLAVAAYNAGPGNVNKWLRANGDPRGGGVDWVEWVEKIPLSETRNYVQRVLENAVVYETMNPARALNKGPNPLSFFLGKRYPG
jgi:soluble lytic murein transglycosylase